MGTASVRIAARLTLAAALVWCSQAAGAPARHRAGYWSVTPASAGRCAADIRLEDGGLFTLLAAPDGVSFGVRPGRPIALGRRGLFEMDTGAFQFEASHGRAGGHFYHDDVMDAGSLKALRAAKALRIWLDKRPVAQVVLAGTGTPEVLDAVVACSRGRSGWWGAGAR